jgi:hypothetical protein
VGEWHRGARRLVAVALALSWLMVAVAFAVGIGNPLTTALSSAGLAAALAIVSRALCRSALHQVPRLRQRTIIIGSGVVAGQLVHRLRVTSSSDSTRSAFSTTTTTRSSLSTSRCWDAWRTWRRYCGTIGSTA